MAVARKNCHSCNATCKTYTTKGPDEQPKVVLPFDCPACVGLRSHGYLAPGGGGTLHYLHFGFKFWWVKWVSEGPTGGSHVVDLFMSKTPKPVDWSEVDAFNLNDANPCFFFFCIFIWSRLKLWLNKKSKNLFLFEKSRRFAYVIFDYEESERWTNGDFIGLKLRRFALASNK